MEESLPCYFGLIWRLAAKLLIGKDFLSKPVRHHGYGGAYRVWKNGFSVKSHKARCKPWNVPRKAGNKPGNGAGTDSKDVYGPTWTYPDPLGKPRPFQQRCPPTDSGRSRLNPEGWESPPDPAANKKPTCHCPSHIFYSLGCACLPVQHRKPAQMLLIFWWHFQTL